ncbi:MAG: hypothetical protein NZM12_06970, partial [Steroidobacteraceae bacterium]|nr:hypothetical protein [Steroidobacteraceae bacterium]
ERLWLRVGGPATVSASEVDYCLQFLDRVAQAEQSPGWAGRTDIEWLLDETYAASRTAPDGAVQLLTIHEAKGLEFDHVVVCGLGQRLPAPGSPLFDWLELPRGDALGSDFVLAPAPDRAVREPPLLNQWMRHTQAQRQRHERLRLLYVAMTRARDSLLLVASRSGTRAGASWSPPKNTALALLWPALAERFLAAAIDAAPSASKRTESGVRPLRRLPADWRAAVPPAHEVAASQQTLASAAGESERTPDDPVALAPIAALLSRALQRLAARARCTGSVPIDCAADPAWRRQLLSTGMPAAEVQTAVDRIGSAVARMLQDPAGRWILDPTHRDPHERWALSGVVHGALVDVVIDRSFVDADGRRWIVDYAIGEPADGAIDSYLARECERRTPRLERCAELLRNLPGAEPTVVRAAIYFPLLARLVTAI